MMDEFLCPSLPLCLLGYWKVAHASASSQNFISLSFTLALSYMKPCSRCLNTFIRSLLSKNINSPLMYKLEKIVYILLVLGFSSLYHFSTVHVQLKPAQVLSIKAQLLMWHLICDSHNDVGGFISCFVGSKLPWDIGWHSKTEQQQSSACELSWQLIKFDPNLTKKTRDSNSIFLSAEWAIER